MVDVHTVTQRSFNMRSIRGKNTKPEVLVRKVLHANGYRFRLNDRSLPGTPDVVFSRKKAVLQVNGCFWHSHSCSYGQVSPATNAEFWEAKRAATIARDARNSKELQALGWRVMTIWECEVRNLEEHLPRVFAFLGNPATP